MANLSDLYDKKRKYENLRGSIEQIISSLNIGINNLEYAASNIPNYYNVNTLSADNGKTGIIRGSLMDKKNFLSNTIIPAINNAIYGVNVEIQRTIEENRRREEEERKKREAELLKKQELNLMRKLEM